MIPDGWQKQPLASITKVIDCKHRTPVYVDQGIPLVSPGTIKWGAIDLDTPTKRVTQDEYELLMDHCTVDIGDLVLSRNQSVGVASYVDTNIPFVLGQDTVLIKPEKIDSAFLFFKLQSVDVQRTISKLAGGSTFSRINLSDIRNLYFDTPPLPEQKKIAQILSTWDKTITTTEQLLANSQQQKKALMQQLLTGKKRLRGFEGEWEIVKLGDVFEKIANGLTYDPQVTEGLPVTRIETISTGKVNYLKVGFAPNEKNTIRFKLKKEDILYSHINSLEHIGRVALYGAEQPLYHGMNLLLLRVKGDLSKRFFFHLLNSHIGKKYAKTYAKSAVNQASISTTDLKSFKVKIPIVEEQQAIAAVLSAADREIEVLQQKLEGLKQEKKALMQQLLTGKRRVKA